MRGVSVVALCRSIADARELRLAVLGELRRRVGFDAFVWLLTDPATTVGAAPVADVGSAVQQLPRLIELKYTTAVNRWTAMREPVRSLHGVTGGRLERSRMWRELLYEHEVADVASMVFRDRHGWWSFLDLWRCGSTFTPAELDVLTSYVDDLTAAFRRCTVATFACSTADVPLVKTSPAVLVLSPDLAVRAQTPETERYLRVLVPPDGDAPVVPAGAYNVAAQLRANEEGVDDRPPVARVHLHDGAWLTLRAARIGDEIAVTLEPTTSVDRCDLIARAAALTPRQAELLLRLIAGADTRALAQQMGVSAHTVQDHLKVIFAKTGADSRRELVARVIRS